MYKYLLIFCLATGAYAQEKYFTKWDYTKLIKSVHKSGQKMQHKAMQRHIVGKGLKTPIASTIFTFMPSYQGKESLANIAKKIKQSSMTSKKEGVSRLLIPDVTEYANATDKSNYKNTDDWLPVENIESVKI